MPRALATGTQSTGTSAWTMRWRSWQTGAVANEYSPPRTRQAAEEADRCDPLRRYRDRFVVGSGGPIYLDGNSLGRPTRWTAGAVSSLLEEWAKDLVGGWDRWADLPGIVGEHVGQLLGAAPGQVTVSDSTTVNLYKLAAAALDARPERPVVVGDANDFPTVRYVLEGLAAREGRKLRLIESDPTEGLLPGDLGAHLSGDVALVCLSAVNFRSGAVVDMVGANEAAHLVGALTLWDLSHAAGAIPVDLDASGADLAVGCGYKYLNGGPGAPSWLYARAGLQASLRQPVWGWWGQQDQFEMAQQYEPVPGVGRFLTGTPAVLGLVALDAGLTPLLEAGMPAVWEKARRLVDLLARRCEELLTPLGARLASPASPSRRGGHLAVAHSSARAATRLLIDRGLVVPDFRPPDVVRLAPVPLYTSYVDVWDAVERIAGVLASPLAGAGIPKKRVT